MKDEYGLIGYPLTHSFSPAYFNAKFRREGIHAIYHSFSIPSINELHELLRTHPRLRGLNVTIPYKQAVTDYLHELDEAAATVGAVNCIAIRNGHLIGYNTDIIGFGQSLQPLLQPNHTQALVLGTGGASSAVVYVLEKLGIGYQLVSRQRTSVAISYDQLTDEMVANHPLIINTTPLGMYPDVATMPPLPSAAIGNGHLVYDLVYNPKETLFLKMGMLHGAQVKNGLEMLHLQAEAAWHIWG